MNVKITCDQTLTEISNRFASNTRTRWLRCVTRRPTEPHAQHSSELSQLTESCEAACTFCSGDFTILHRECSTLQHKLNAVGGFARAISAIATWSCFTLKSAPPGLLR
eukprot:5021890-Amphidinium_carterae.2